MVNYRLTNKARFDLIDIWDYTVKTWSIKQAQKYYNQLIESFKFITQNLTVGKEYSEIRENLFGVRVGKHIAFYQIENEDNILIIRVLHEQMDLSNRLSE